MAILMMIFCSCLGEGKSEVADILPVVPAEFGAAKGIATDGKVKFLVAAKGIFPQQAAGFDTKHPLQIIWGKVSPEELRKFQFDVIPQVPDSARGQLFVQVMTVTEGWKNPELKDLIAGKKAEKGLVPAVAGVCQYIPAARKLRFIPIFGGPRTGDFSQWKWYEKGKNMIEFRLTGIEREFMIFDPATQFLKGVVPPRLVEVLPQLIAKIEEKIKATPPKDRDPLIAYKQKLEKELEEASSGKKDAVH